MKVPFFRPSLTDAEVNEVVDTLRSGWLTTGPKVQRFEEGFAAAVGASHAVALNSATAALHLALESLGLRAGDGVLVPTLTFAATAEVVRYFGATPVLVDSEADSLNLDLSDAARRLASPTPTISGRIVGLIPVHVGGAMMDVERLREFASRHALWMVEDAAHAFPAAWRPAPGQPWTKCGENTAAVTCFSFYANKTLTTGEGGMAVTSDPALADRIRLMSLHGLSKDAWRRYADGASWDYRILAPGFKYNLTDIAASLGIHQLARAEEMRESREEVALGYQAAFADLAEIERPQVPEHRRLAWHLYPIRLRLDRLRVDRNRFLADLQEAGVGCSVHWRPLHMHPYYRETYGFRAEDFPVATREWVRLISLPLFPGMSKEEREHVIASVRRLCARHGRG